MVTISTHNGSAAHREHNIRSEKVVSKEEHINPNGHYEIWKDETPRKAYHRLFDKAVERYNAKQKREDRKIKDYYRQICEDAKKHPVYEMIIGVYPGIGESINVETQRAILKEFVDTWQIRNPNLYMCGAYFHADEQGEPHCHIDYIPIAGGYTRGMDTQTGLVKALEQQGFVKEGKLTAQIQWEKRENEYLEGLCGARGLYVEHPKQSKREHLETDLYKSVADNLKEIDIQTKALIAINQQKEDAKQSIKSMEVYKEDLQDDIEHLQDDIKQMRLEVETLKKEKTLINKVKDITISLTRRILKLRAEIPKQAKAHNENLKDIIIHTNKADECLDKKQYEVCKAHLNIAERLLNDDDGGNIMKNNVVKEVTEEKPKEWSPYQKRYMRNLGLMTGYNGNIGGNDDGPDLD